MLHCNCFRKHLVRYRARLELLELACHPGDKCPLHKQDCVICCSNFGRRVRKNFVARILGDGRWSPKTPAATLLEFWATCTLLSSNYMFIILCNKHLFSLRLPNVITNKIRTFVQIKWPRSHRQSVIRPVQRGNQIQ